jgi:anaerobic selenocysteine-containing dehydrogenase
MCHESTSVALPETIGVPVGTVKIEDFADTDCMFFFGQNVGVKRRLLRCCVHLRKTGGCCFCAASPPLSRLILIAY